MTNTTLIGRLANALPDPVTQEKLIRLAQRAFIDYLGSYYLALDEKSVINLATSLNIEDVTEQLFDNRGIPLEQEALFNGFTAHYLDIDNVQAHFRGHPGAVIFSSLLAVSQKNDRMRDLLWSFVVGVELAGKLGKVLNPEHAQNGWHSTGTIGSVAAALAIAVYKGSSLEQTCRIISLATTQAAGTLKQEGTDGKPLNAGFAARNAVSAYQLAQVGLSAELDPFADADGWIKLLSGRSFDARELSDCWLSPSEIESPGLWYKNHPICSAALSGYDAGKLAYQAGVRFSEIEQIICHYPKFGDSALTQTAPQTGIEGKFSIEYILWLVLTKGDISNADFLNRPVDNRFEEADKKISRIHDLAVSNISKRPIKLEIVRQGHSEFFTVEDPKGSPENPLNEHELVKKAISGMGGAALEVERLLKSEHATIADFIKIEKNSFRRISASA